MMKIFIYYTALLAPIILFIWLGSKGHVTLLGISIIIYALIYRPLIDGYKLILKGLITGKEVWKIYLPSTYRKYFRELYLS